MSAPTTSSAPAATDHGIPERTVAEIRSCLKRFPQIHWLKLYGSRAMGRHWRGSDIDLAYSSDEDCSAALREALTSSVSSLMASACLVESLMSRLMACST